jgi:hypothetical protein
MNDTGKKFLELMFRPDEQVCVSYNKYGYHSVPLKHVLERDTIMIVSTPQSCEDRGISWLEGHEQRFTDELTLVALNPIEGYREDTNCTAFRNFMVEIDVGTQEEQLAHLKHYNIPYSALVFSGNKSLHCLISLTEDLPNEEIWRTLAEWILNVITLSDKATKNPSRSIRIPEVWRDPKKKQTLLELKSAINVKELIEWLSKYPEAKPKKQEKHVYGENPGVFDLNMMPKWVQHKLTRGLSTKKGRNQQWYGIAYEFALAGFSKDDTIDILGGFFTPERDFKVREWKMAINSAFKNVKDK